MNKYYQGVIAKVMLAWLCLSFLTAMIVFLVSIITGISDQNDLKKPNKTPQELIRDLEFVPEKDRAPTDKIYIDFI